MHRMFSLPNANILVLRIQKHSSSFTTHKTIINEQVCSTLFGCVGTQAD